MTSEPYTISELAQRAGVTVRTIRYYISQGLLPAPGMSGQTDRYDDRYVERLEIIKRLKAEYLPLEKIRELLNELGEQPVIEALAEASPPHSSAKAYIRALLHPDQAGSVVQQLERKRTESAEVAALPVLPRRASMAGMTANHSPAPIVAEISAPTGQTWQRFRINSDVELNVRTDTSNEYLEKHLPEIIAEIIRLCR